MTGSPLSPLLPSQRQCSAVSGNIRAFPPPNTSGTIFACPPGTYRSVETPSDIPGIWFSAWSNLSQRYFMNSMNSHEFGGHNTNLLFELVLCPHISHPVCMALGELRPTAESIRRPPQKPTLRAAGPIELPGARSVYGISSDCVLNFLLGLPGDLRCCC